MEKKTGRIALVLHQGQKYGNLFFKDLFYSTDSDSDLHPERILHIDYSGIPCPSENLTWVSLGHRCNSFAARIFYSFRIISKGIPRIRRLRHILTLAILARIYVSFKKYHTGLEPYPELKIALIDYEILCPKELLLAFESRNIRTVAAQERFFVSFNNLFGSTIVSHYLCASPFSADIINRSPLYCVDVTLPVGQYRSDILLEMQKTSVPPVIGAFQNKGFRIITALGFHTSRNWQESHADPMLNWSAHRVFLEDMIRLSTDIPDVAIILRFKDISWMELPVFADILEKIKETDNMIISTDYEKTLVSYDLCAHSDLVIARHTSLADECLSIGIPVLFHDYTHNTEQLVSGAFDYSPARVMCKNYKDLCKNAKNVLSGVSPGISDDYEYLKKTVYGGLGDGMVRNRVHMHIMSMLKEE